MQKLITAILIVFSSLSIMANESDDSKTIKEKVNDKDSFSYVIINTDYGNIKIRLYNETHVVPLTSVGKIDKKALRK